MYWAWRMIDLGLVLITATLLVQGCNRTSFRADPNDAAQVERGRLIYALHCARCHGSSLEGQPNWRTRSAEGRLPAPPHDDSGHTWHHPDQMLVGIIQHGLVPPYAPDGYVSDMPAFGASLPEPDIWAVLAFIKSKWSTRSREFQAEITQRERQSSL